MKTHESIRNMVVYAMLGTLMFAAKIAMEGLPNIHPLGMLIMAYTVVYRSRALIPLYLYVFLNGAYSGFSMWWLPYTYVWTVLWGMTMLIPKKIPKKIAAFVYPIVCGLHGLMFGILYAPCQAIMFGYSFSTTLKWIAAGFPFDVLHAAGNVVMGLLVLPIAEILRRLDRNSSINK